MSAENNQTEFYLNYHESNQISEQIRQHSLYSLVNDSSDELNVPDEKKTDIWVFFLLPHAKKVLVDFF